MSARGSEVYDLGTPYNMGMPVHPSHPPYVFTLQRRHGDTMRPGWTWFR